MPLGGARDLQITCPLCGEGLPCLRGVNFASILAFWHYFRFRRFFGGMGTGRRNGFSSTCKVTLLVVVPGICLVS